MMRLLQLMLIFLPWFARRRLLSWIFGYDLSATSHIGWAWIYPRKLILEDYATIGHLTVCKGLDLLHVRHHASIGRGNWITGYPSGSGNHFSHQLDRQPELILGEHAAITNRHLIDCTNRVEIGRFSTLAGFQSQILTHSIDLKESRQSSEPILIGDYCFVGTKCVLLGGCALPDYSVLGAKSLLNKCHAETHRLYAGSPALPVKELPATWRYFSRPSGFVA